MFAKMKIFGELTIIKGCRF